MPKTRLCNIISAVSHMLLIYTAIFVPFQVAFLSDLESQTLTLEIMDQTVNTLFIIEFVLNFITAVEINGKVEFKLNKIAVSYL